MLDKIRISVPLAWKFSPEYFEVRNSHILSDGIDGEYCAVLNANINKWELLGSDINLRTADEAKSASMLTSTSRSAAPTFSKPSRRGADEETYLSSGMDGYVSKPINAQELFTLIESLPATVKVDRN